MSYKAQIRPLTTGIDTLVGGAGNDIFNAPMTDGGTPTQTLGGLDSVDGGGGFNTMNVDFGAGAIKLPVTATIKNIQELNTATNGNSGADLDVTSITGIQKVTVANGGTGATKVVGGETVSVIGGGGATTNVEGKALTSVSIAKTAGTTVTVDNLNAATGVSGTGTTLTDVTLSDLAAGATTAAIKGDAINTVSINNQKSALATTITNTVSKDLTVNVNGSGYNAAGTADAVSVAAGAKASDITVNATGAKSNVKVTAAAAKTLNLTGDAALTLTGVTGAALSSIDGSAATGDLDLGGLNAGTAKVTTGSGNDKFTVNAKKATVDAGAGNDTVTLASTLEIGSTINLGAGDDVLLSTGGVVTGKNANGTVIIDGGDGIDTVAASLINAANATQFVNFERIDASAGNTILDINLMTGSAIDGVSLNVGAGTVTLQNLAAGAGLTVAGANTGSLTVGVKGAATNKADTFAIDFAGQAAPTATAAVPTAVSASKVGLEGVETVTVASNGTGFVTNTLSLAANTKLQELVITGDKDLSLSFTAANAGVKSIDGSAATGALTVDLTNVAAAATGLTVKGGSGDDKITTIAGQSATLTGGAGEDSFLVTDTVVGATATAAGAVKTVITDFAAGDKITGLTGMAAATTQIELDNTVQNLDDAFGLLTTKGDADAVNWFNYGDSTYVVFNDNTAAFGTADVLVELTGVIDLSNATVLAGVLELA